MQIQVCACTCLKHAIKLIITVLSGPVLYNLWISVGKRAAHVAVLLVLSLYAEQQDAVSLGIQAHIMF